MQCPRKWYYSEIFSSPRSKESIRKEAYLLKQLQSIHAWRGSLVDKVISTLIATKLRFNKLPTEQEALSYADDLADRQLAFGRACRHRASGLTKSGAGDEYCAFYDLEYNGCLDEAQILQARKEIKTSLQNLFRSDFFNSINNGDTLGIIPQRTLMFQFADTTISCTPDLIVLFKNSAPLIVDWKVHYFGISEYWLQLGIYAVALSRVNPHKDFPSSIHDRLKDPTRIRLIEYQLLNNNQRDYSISEDDVAEIEDYIFKSSLDINNAVDGRKPIQLKASDFQSARSPNTCARCQFKKMCWESPAGDSHDAN